jgi:beta-glucanase (GH16 family)
VLSSCVSGNPRAPGGAAGNHSPIVSSLAPRLVFSDSFEGPAGAPPNPANWQPVTGGTGWGNQEVECYTASRLNSALDGHGDLVITALKQPGYPCSDGATDDYTSARLTSENLHAFQYGTISVRAKLPTGQGIWPAFWALGQDYPVVGWPDSGEIDITEVTGKHPAITNASIHGPGMNGLPYDLTNEFDANVNLDTAFHVYSTTWTPTALTFSIDGTQYFKVTASQVKRVGGWEFDQPFYLLLDVAVGGSFPGPPSAATPWPQQMIVSYVRVYQRG